MPAGGYTSEAYREARRASLSAVPDTAGEKPLRGRLCVYASAAPCAQAAAKALCPGAAVTVHEGLNEAEPAPGLLPNAALPLALRARLDTPRGDAKKRAEALVAELERAGEDAALFSHPNQLPQLMDALRRRGCCFQRTALGALRPGERILATSRAAHCGGCGHNCMLTNPGCGVGRDKALRAGIPFQTGETHGTDKR